MSRERTRRDRCPGVLRPWIADDGALVRMRLIGGRTNRDQLARLAHVAEEHGDGWVYLTKRANLQIRGLRHSGGRIDPAVAETIAAAGLLPAPDHELVRNVMVSPLTGRAGGRADLWPAAEALDTGLITDPGFANLAGRFLFCLDDGRGDIADRSLDLGLVALDSDRVQLRLGARDWGPIVALDEVAGVLLDLARTFLDVRGDDADAWWHVDELPDRGRSLATTHERDPRTRVSSAPPHYGIISQGDGRHALHREVPGGRLNREQADLLPATTLIVTPWRSIVATDLEELPKP